MPTSVPKRLQQALGANVVNIYDALTDVASGATVTLVSYEVPTGKTLYLSLVEVGGGNIANYEILHEATTIGFKRIYFGGDLTSDLFYNYYQIGAGETIQVKVNNFRPSVADFEGRILGVLE